MLQIPLPGTTPGNTVLIKLLACRGPQRIQVVLPAADAPLPYLTLVSVPPGVAALLRVRALPEAWLPIASIRMGSAISLG
jgi:putative effector of murein hydrolase LrgA (UPF0299 family)